MELFFTGKTVEEATAKALEQLGIARDEISIEVVEMPVKKLFRSIPAKIRVTLLAEEAEAERKAQKEARPAAREDRPAAKQPARPAAQQAKMSDKSSTDKSSADKPFADKSAAEKPAAVRPAAEKAAEKPVKKAAPVPAPAAPEAAAAPAAPEAPAQEPAPLNPEKVELAKTFLETVAADMGVTGFVVTPQQQQETLVLKVEGENLGILIGRRGETMEALSYLTGLVANRLGGDYQKVALDVAGYRSKRENDLVALAKRVGGKVAKTGRSYTMEPMNPYERRIIHSTISRMEGVTSESTGEGDNRRVVVSSTDPNAAKSNVSRGGRGGKKRGPRGPENRGPRDGENRTGRPGGHGGPRGGRGGDRGPRREQPRTEYKERSREQTAAPVAGERSETVNDAPSVSLYGKIEL